jgi:predicted DNA-binding transcriptional regulator AlpA
MPLSETLLGPLSWGWLRPSGLRRDAISFAPMPESFAVLAEVQQGYLRLADMTPLLGVTKQRCHQLAQRDDFPAPAKLLRGRSRSTSFG